MTLTTQLVLHVLLGDPTEERYGLEIGTVAGVESARAALARVPRRAITRLRPASD